MSHYRLYFISKRTGRIEQAEDFEFDDDAQAMAAVRAGFANQPLELWCGTRKVARFEAERPAPPSPVQDGGSESTGPQAARALRASGDAV